MSLMLKSILGFGMMGTIIIGIIAGFTISLATESGLFYHILSWIIGFCVGSVTCIIIIKFSKMTEEDFKKGLEYECPKCRNGVFESEPICDKCGYVLELDR